MLEVGKRDYEVEAVPDALVYVCVCVCVCVCKHKYSHVTFLTGWLACRFLTASVELGPFLGI